MIDVNNRQIYLQFLALLYIIVTRYARKEWVLVRATSLNNFYICRDPKDNKFIDLAVNGFADFLITGDQDLLSLKVVDDTKIVTPRAFLDLLR